MSLSYPFLYWHTQSTEIIFEPPSCKSLYKICWKKFVLSHRLINAFDLHYIHVHTIMSIVVVLSRNIKYLASSQQGFSCDKALSTLYDQKKIHLLHLLTLCIPETLNENFWKQWKPRWNAAYISFSRLHYIRVYTVCKVKKNTMFFENYNLAPLKLYNGLSQVYCIKPDGLIH